MKPQITMFRQIACRSFCSLFFFAICIASLPAFAQVSDFAMLAPDETLVFAQAENLSQLRAAWAQTPYSRLWADPKFKPFLKPLKTKIDEKRQALEKEEGVTLQELEQIFSGQISVFLSELRFSQNEASQEIMAENNTGLIGRFSGDKERVRRIVEEQVFKDLPSGSKRFTESFQGATIYVTQFKETSSDQPDQLASPRIANQPQENELAVPKASNDSGSVEYYYEYAFVDDIFIILEGPRAFMKKVLANYFAAKKNGSSVAGLAGTANYQGAFHSLENKPEARFFINVERLLRQLNQNPSSKIFENTKPLRLEEIKSLALSVRLTPRATELDLTLAATQSPQGAARFFINDHENAFLSKTLTPSDSIIYSCSSLDFSDVFRLIRDFIGHLNKDQGRAFDQILEQMAQGTGVSVPALLAQTGREIAWISFPVSTSDTSIGQNQKAAQVALVHLKNEEGFAAKLAKLLPSFIAGPAGAQSGTSNLETADFKGTMIYTIKGTPMPGAAKSSANALEPRMSFAVARSFLIIGSQAEAVRRILQQVHGETAENITNNPAFRGATASLKQRYSGLIWYDLKTIVEEAIRSIQAQPVLLLALGQFVQTTQMPAPQDFSRYFGQMTGAIYTSPGMFHSRLLIQYPQ